MEQYNVTLRRYACMALTNLTFGDGTNKASLCSMKPAMRALVSQLFSANEELCQVAASVLRNLSWKADMASQKTLREVTAVTSLVQAAMRVTKEKTLKTVLSALWNLSAQSSENKADICAVDGALAFLISSLTYKSPSKTTAIIENGGGILRNVSSHIAVREDYRKVLRQHGCLQILLKHLRSPSLTIVSNACGTLWNLSARCAEDQQALWEMGAVNMLRNLVNSKHNKISDGSSAALKNLLAARPAMKNLELNKQGNMNRPTLHVRKQRALESEIDQNLSETCENVESPRDSPVESKKPDACHFVYPVYHLQDNDHRRSLLRGQIMPRSHSGGDNTLSLENQMNNQQRVSRSGSQDSVGSTHSDISHNRSRTNLATRNHVNMGGSLDRNKETLQPAKRHNSDGRCERNPLGPPNSRILQVMQEVAMHAGLEGQGSQNNDSAVFKTPLPVSHSRVPHQQHQTIQPQREINHPILNAQQASMYQMYIMHNSGNQFNSRNSNHHQNRPEQSHNDQHTDDEDKPLDYSLKYHENSVQGEASAKKGACQTGPKQPMIGNFLMSSQPVPNIHKQFGGQPKHVFFDKHAINNRLEYNSAYAETDLDAPDQLTDFSARYGAEYQSHQYSEQRIGYDNNYEERDPNCADCKLEEARRYNDRLEQTMENDQVTTFCTEDTPYLSTATSLTDLSTAAKILEEAQQQYSGNERDHSAGDETHNFSSKYSENEKKDMSENKPQPQGHKFETDHSSRSGSQTTDQCTGTTVIPNYNLSKPNRNQIESLSHSNDEIQERSFHNTCSEDAPADQTKTYCEEGTPVCFSRVSSLSSLHSSDANDRQDKRPVGPLQSIEENEDVNSSLAKLKSACVPQNSVHQKNESIESKEANDNIEKEHKTVTFDEKEHIQETPMMFSRCTSLGSLSSFDTQSVHSSVFSEYSRRASENVSPSELPDSPSESMPSSPGRVKSPERFHDNKKASARQELFPNATPPQFTNRANSSAKHIHPLTAFVAMGNSIQLASANHHFDIETSSSCKSEAPVVYADEGTPPIFQDNLSTLSEITSDHYNLNDKTLVENPESGSSNKSACQEDGPAAISKFHTGHSSDSGKGIPNAQQQSFPSGKPNTMVASLEILNKSGKDLKPENIMKDKGDSSTSDVSEGEDDLLANIISSAMPNSSKKMRKSSSDNAIKRKSSSSSKTESASSSRSKTPAKTPTESPAGKPGMSKKVQNGSVKEPDSAKKVSKLGSENTEKSQIKNKQKSMLPTPSTHPDVKRVLNDGRASLNSSIDSSKSDTPFNVSNTQSVIDRHTRQFPQTRGDNHSANLLILQKMDDLPVYDDEEEGIRTYATEDTPFSGSIPASPKSGRKFNVGHPAPDLNQDSVKTFATEGTPFSGSMPGSPKPQRASNFNYTETEPDTVKCYNTEDTPFTGSAPESPKMLKKEVTTQPSVNQHQQSQKQRAATVQNTSEVDLYRNTNARYISRQPPVIDTSEDTVRSYATEGTPYNQSNLPSPKPSSSKGQFKFNPQFLGNLDCISNGFESNEDQVKTFATEGTPLNYSRTGSFSDLSSLNTNFEEKVKIDPKAEPKSNEQNFDDTNSDNSSLMEENEELLSEIIQSAMPAAKTGKSSRRSMDRKAEGSEGKRSFSFDNSSKKNKPSKVPSKFQPQRTSSLAHDTNLSNAVRVQNEVDMFEDQVKTFAVEDTPNNASVKTSLSDLTIDTESVLGNKKGHDGVSGVPSKLSTGDISLPNRSSDCTNASMTATFGTSNDSVFIQSDFGAGDSMRVYKTEGTPQTFSCNDSLSNLSIQEDEKNGISRHIVFLANQISNGSGTDVRNIGHNEKQDTTAKEQLPRSDSRSSGHSNVSGHSVKELERHVIGQSSEDQSLHEEEQYVRKAEDEIKKFGVEDTPLCFSRNSSLSSINDPVESQVVKQSPSSKTDAKEEEEKTKQASKDQKTSYKVEHTPLCFSRNSSLSSLSIHSDEDDDPEDLALLEDCISSALPPPNRPIKTDRRRSSHGSKGDRSYRKGRSADGTNTAYHLSHHSSSSRNYSSGDELEVTGTHDSRYTIWRQQPHKSCDEIFKKPTMDSKGRPCRRSRSQDSETKMLKQYKDHSNKELVQQYIGHVTKYGPGGSVDSLPRESDRFEVDEVEKQRQQIISESQNLTRSIEHQVRELEYQTKDLSIDAEKSDEHENEKNDTPTSEQNFFMTCSGITEISVESISKQSFPSSMAPDDTDDDILQSSLTNSRFSTDGGDCNLLSSGLERTLTGTSSINTTLTENSMRANVPLDLSITSEDEKALAENANIVMSEMAVSRMGISCSTVEDDKFIEHETLSLVSNDYISDTASEGSNTWSLGSDRTSEYTESHASTETGSSATRRPRIVKPEDQVEVQKINEAESKAIRGKRKPLYHSKSVSSASPSSPNARPEVPGKNKMQAGSATKLSPRSVPGMPSTAKKKTHALRTLPQASSTPVKNNPNQNSKTKASRTSQPQRSASLDQKSYKSTVGQRIANNSVIYSTPTKIPSKSSPRSKSEGSDHKEKPKTLSKQGTFVKESTNINAPVISSNEQTYSNIKMRQKKDSDSSLGNRNSMGSSKSINSNNISFGSDDSPHEHGISSTQESCSFDTTPKKKDSKLRRSIGTSQLTTSRKNLASKIPSPSKNTANKSGTTAVAKRSNGKPSPMLKTSSGTCLVKTNSGSNSSLKKIDSLQEVKKYSSNSSMKNNSRPSTPSGMAGTKEGLSNKAKENGKKGTKKAVANKISSILKKDGKESKGKGVSKLPVAKSKNTPDHGKKDCSPRPAINRNTVILSEPSINVPVVDGITRSSTYDKLKVTNEHSQIPSHDDSDNSSSNFSSNKNTSNKIEDLDKTKKFDYEFEVGVEYNLDDAWASRVEKSIEIMSRSIEENKNLTNYYDHDIDISTMNFSSVPAKRLSKSGSMSEIELEFGRIHSGTWTKKKSHNDFATLPNADETSRTLPLVKRAESLNFNMGYSNDCLMQYDSESEDVWIRRDDKMRMSDNSMSVKSKKKGFKGSSSFLPIKNVVSKVFGSKKSDKEKQSKSVIEFSKQSRSFVSEKELKKMNESNCKSNKKDKDMRMNKSDIIKLSKSDLKAEAKLVKAEQKAEAKQLKAEAKQKKAEMKALKKGKKVQQNVEVKHRESETQNLNSSLTSLKKSAEDLIDIDHSDDEDSDSFTMPMLSKSSISRSENNKSVNNGAVQNGTLSKNESVFYSQTLDHQNAEKLSLSSKSSSESVNSPPRNQSGIHNRSVKQSPTSQHVTKTEMLLARRQQILNSTSSQDRSETDEDGKRKCIVTTV